MIVVLSPVVTFKILWSVLEHSLHAIRMNVYVSLFIMPTCICRCDDTLGSTMKAVPTPHSSLLRTRICRCGFHAGQYYDSSVNTSGNFQDTVVGT
jgi:hypothetical protein